MSDGNYKPGSFPDGDEANVWGKLYLDFVQDRRSGRDPTAAYQGALEWAYSKCKHDPEFIAYYNGIRDQQLSAAQMNRVLGECKAVLDRRGFWRYREVPIDTSEWVVPGP